VAEAVHLEAIEHILGSISGAGEFQLSSFLFGRPGASIHERNLGTDVYANRRDFIRALIFLRSNGAPYLHNLSVGDLWSRVTNFITDNYWYIAQDTLGRRIVAPYSEVVSGANKIALADALARSPLFVTPDTLSLFPLLTIRCHTSFESSLFFLVPPEELTSERVWRSGSRQQLDGRTVPPFSDWEGRRRPVTSWLGVHAALPPIARKTAASILGALALTKISRLRYQFSGREMYGGFCAVDEGWTYTPSDDPHTPALMDDIVLTETDRSWLESLAELLASDALEARRRKRALEYFYRAWFLDPRERFPVLCMSLDSLVGAESGHTAAAVRYVTSQIPEVDEARLRLLLRIRGAVIHGAAPDVYDSTSYETYYVNYETDPIKDVELIVSRCLRDDIFHGTLRVHRDPNQELIEQMQRIGRLPARLDEGQIIGDED
jgi:hypothetical protein